ncbi:hypothetical protein NKG94_12780 [Micromonospora sp. M12]
MSNADDRATARRTLIVLGLVLATAFALAFVYATRRVLVWAVVAAFFAVALKPLVDRLQRRVVRRRALATLLVFLAAFVLLAVLAALILVPLFGELGRFADRAPELLHDARAGRGRWGRCWSAPARDGTSANTPTNCATSGAGCANPPSASCAVSSRRSPGWSLSSCSRTSWCWRRRGSSAAR